MRWPLYCSLLCCLPAVSLLAGCQKGPQVDAEVKAELVAVDEPQQAAMSPTFRPATHRDATADEIQLVETLVDARNRYKATLRALDAHYAAVGDGTKAGWVQSELTDFQKMRKFRYLAEAEIAGPTLKAAVRIAAADTLYDEAMHLKRTFSILGIGMGEKLRIAVEKFNRIIREHPTSDKIDDAAYQAGEIYADRHFKDYWRAVLYFQRAYQWDPNTPWPARLRAAEVLDHNLLERRTALKLYNEALTRSQSDRARQRAHARIKQLSKEPL